jgi:hypothetical protein
MILRRTGVRRVSREGIKLAVVFIIICLGFIFGFIYDHELIHKHIAGYYGLNCDIKYYGFHGMCYHDNQSLTKLQNGDYSDYRYLQSLHDIQSFQALWISFAIITGAFIVKVM